MSSVEPFTISRVFNAPRAIVFQAFTDPAQILRWFAPPGGKMLKASMDLRVGGVYHYGYQTPDGSEMWGKQRFLEVVAPEKLVFIQSFSDPEGGLTRHPLAATWPLEMHSTSTFEALDDGKTKLTVSWYPYNSDDAGNAMFDTARPNMSGGFQGMFASLDTYLGATETEIVNSRLLNAPRELVWKALTDPKHVNVWWGPNGFKNIDVEQDVRVGGVWRFKMVGPDGTVYPNEVTYLEIQEPERLVYDHGDDKSVRFRGMITLTEEDGKTRISLGVKFPSREARDAVLRFGVVEGGQQTLHKLDVYLQTM